MAGRKKEKKFRGKYYRTRVTVGHDKGGKPIIVPVYGKTIEERDQKVAQIRLEKGLGVSVADRKSTFGYWAEAWKKISYPHMGKSTRDMYNAALGHLRPVWNEKISKLADMDISNIIRDMEAEGYSRRTIKSVISAVRQVCKFAKKHNALVQNIYEDLKPDKNDPVEEREPITPEEEELIWNVKPLLPAKNKLDSERAKKLPEARMMALMMLNCGHRKEEVVMLEWKTDINWNEQTVMVDDAYSFAERKPKGPKSKSGFRAKHIPDRYFAELKEWYKTISNTLWGSKYLFPGSHGTLADWEFRNLWEVLLDAINGIAVADRISVRTKQAKAKKLQEQIKSGKSPKKFKPSSLVIPPDITREHNFTSHQMRHTFASAEVEDGVDIMTLQYELGHSTPTMALKYAHRREAIKHAQSIQKAQGKKA